MAQSVALNYDVLAAKRKGLPGKGALDDGTWHCWGYEHDCSMVDFTGVTAVYTTSNAFLVLKEGEETGVCWANANVRNSRPLELRSGKLLPRRN